MRGPTGERDRERRKDDVYALDENYKARHLWSVSVAGGAEKQLTSGEFSVAGLSTFSATAP